MSLPTFAASSQLRQSRQNEENVWEKMKNYNNLTVLGKHSKRIVSELREPLNTEQCQ